jgi:CRISPR-associated protein (TIGR03986 family)
MAEELDGTLSFNKKNQRFLEFTTKKGGRMSLVPAREVLSPQLRESREAKIQVKVQTGKDGRPSKVYTAGDVWANESSEAAPMQPPVAQQGFNEVTEMNGQFHNPYNFVPVLPRPQTATGELADREPSGHDRYCADKYSGKLRVRMRVATPLLLPDTARMHYHDEHKSYPVRLKPLLDKDGKIVTYASGKAIEVPDINPTAVKGMLRTAYEAVTNSRLSIFQKHGERLAFRMDARDALKLVPARIHGSGKNREVYLYTGKSNMENDGSPKIIQPKTKEKPEIREPMYAAWLKTYYKVTHKIDNNAIRLEKDNRLPKHGEKICAWVKKDNHFYPNFSFYGVKKAALNDAKLGNAPSNGCLKIEGYACITGRNSGSYNDIGSNIKNKHDERVFFFDSSNSKKQLHIKLEPHHEERWKELLDNCREIHKSESPPKDDQGKQLQWSRHINDLKTPAQKEEYNLEEGTLCYALVKLEDSNNWTLLDLLPVMISRRLHQIAPEKLLPRCLHPAEQIENLSPADRVFGWVNQKGKGAYRGQLRIGTVECSKDANGQEVGNGTRLEDLIERFGANDALDGWLPLQILGQPKPQQGRFYVAKAATGEDAGKAQENGSNNERAGYNDATKGLRGRKVYPHHKLPDEIKESYWQNPLDANLRTPLSNYYREYRRPQKNGQEERDSQNRSVQGWVKPNVEFEFDIHFINLSATEIGALIWLLNLNQPNQEKYFHRFGGGKPLGFGSVRLEIDFDKCDVRDGEALKKFYASLDDTGEGKLDKAALEKLKDEFDALIKETYPTMRVSFLRACEGFTDNKPIHYPRKTRILNQDTKSYEWFVENNKVQRGQVIHGYVLPDLATDKGLPYFDSQNHTKKDKNKAKKKKNLKAITFLGIGRYKETTYVYRDEVAPVTEIFPVALCHFFKPDELLVLVTKDAEQKWFQKFEQQCAAKLKKCPAVKPIRIPDGHSVTDLWEIFGALTKNLNEQDEVIFDITHSFRTLPLLSFLAASFLRVAKDVRIKGIYYGAWEARNPPPPADDLFNSSSTDKSPVFDLTPFLELLAWTTATDLFLKTGNSLSLAEQLSSHADAEMQTLSENLREISQALAVLRPLEAMETAVTLPQNLNDAKAVIRVSAPAFELLFKKVSATYNNLGKRNPAARNKETSTSRVRKQLEMVKLYRSNNRIVHALALARETLVSLLCLHFNLYDLDKNMRSAVGHFIHNRSADNRDNQITKGILTDLYAQERDGKIDKERLKELRNLAKELFKVRNDVLHCGLYEGDSSAAQVFSQSKTLLDRFFAVCQSWT